MRAASSLATISFALLIVVRMPAAQEAQPGASAVGYRSVAIENPASLAALRKELGADAFSLVLKINRLDLEHVRQGDTLAVPDAPADPATLAPFPSSIVRS